MLKSYLSDEEKRIEQGLPALALTAEQTAETVKNFKIYYAKVPGKSENDYSIDHSAGMYMFDKLGKLRVYLSYAQKPEDIASDIQKIL